jgi:hypothetical protein
MKYILGLFVALAIGAVGYFILLEEPLAAQLNKHWSPVSVADQRQRAIDSTFSILHVTPEPALAAGTDFETVTKLLSPSLSEQGVVALRLKGDHQLIRLEADFTRTFGPDDLPPGNGGRDLIGRLKPRISGTVIAYFGITGSQTDSQTGMLSLRLLPAVKSLFVKDVTLADKTDATATIAIVIAILNRYAENLTSVINRAPFLTVSVPASAANPINPADLFKPEISGTPDIKVSLVSKPVTIPLKVGNVAWLVQDDGIALFASLVPAEVKLITPPPATSTFDALQLLFLERLKTALAISSLPKHVWVAASKAVLANIVNSAFHQAEPYLTVAGQVPTLSASQQISFADETTMNCTPKRECAQTRQCDFPASHDTRDCSACILNNPFGGCILRGNDPWCEAQKATQNTIYDADATAKKIDCERIKETNRFQCEAEKSGQKSLCEAAKEGLKRLARTGKFANIDESVGGPAAVRISIAKVQLSDDLAHFGLTLGASGSANFSVHIKFMPLDIVGHLACVADWTEDRDVRVTIVEQNIPINVNLAGKIINGKQVYSGLVRDFGLKLHFQPSPMEVVLQSTNFMLACAPLAGLLNGIEMNLSPLIPNLLEDFDYNQKAISFAFSPVLPNTKVLGKDLKLDAIESTLALIASGKL